MTKPRILLSAVSKKENYEEAVRASGGIPIMEYKPEEMATYDGLILCGGNDINPAYYGEELAGAVDIDNKRDEDEFAIAKEFIKVGKPIMGICRGYQLINILLGGSLHQHLDTTDKHRAGNGDDAVHLVIAEKGSIVEKLYGTKFATNSYHHQAVKQLGKNLIITARAEDGTVEAFEHESLPIFGVQWHPERMCCNHKREDTVDGKTLFQLFMNTVI